MPRSHDAKMSSIESDDDIRIDALRKGHDRGIGSSQGKVRVLIHEMGDPNPVLSDGSLDIKAFETAEEDGLHLRSLLFSDEVGCLGNAKRRNHECKLG